MSKEGIATGTIFTLLSVGIPSTISYLYLSGKKPGVPFIDYPLATIISTWVCMVFTFLIFLCILVYNAAIDDEDGESKQDTRDYSVLFTYSLINIIYNGILYAYTKNRIDDTMINKNALALLVLFCIIFVLGVIAAGIKSA